MYMTCCTQQGLNWDDVLAKKVAPPFKPYISDDKDVGNFSEEFTALAPVDSPAQPPAKHTDIFRVKGGCGSRGGGAQEGRSRAIILVGGAQE